MRHVLFPRPAVHVSSRAAPAQATEGYRSPGTPPVHGYQWFRLSARRSSTRSRPAGPSRRDNVSVVTFSLSRPVSRPWNDTQRSTLFLCTVVVGCILPLSNTPALPIGSCHIFAGYLPYSCSFRPAGLVVVQPATRPLLIGSSPSCGEPPGLTDLSSPTDTPPPSC